MRKRKSGSTCVVGHRIWFRTLLLYFCGFFTASSYAHVCAGVSVERAFHRSDAVMEVERKPDKRANELWIVEDDDSKPDEQVGYILAGITFQVLKTWKGKEVETTQIYVLAMGTGSFHFEENQKYVVFASFYEPHEGEKLKRAEGTEDRPILLTGYCRGNIAVYGDSDSQGIKKKLDLIQEKGTSSDENSEYTKPLRNLIQTMIKSNKKHKSVPE